MMKTIIFFLVVIFLSGVTYSQDTPDKILSIKVTPGSKQVKPNSESELEIKLSIKKGWHINANKPLDKNLVATNLKIKESPDYTVTSIVYPQPVIMSLSFSEDELALYEGEVVVLVKIKPGKKVKGKLNINGEIQFQPCNDQTCLFPFTKPFTAELKIN
jgi:hypothetical protein